VLREILTQLANTLREDGAIDIVKPLQRHRDIQVYIDRWTLSNDLSVILLGTIRPIPRICGAFLGKIHVFFPRRSYTDP
jgi:hypothetical protein